MTEKTGELRPELRVYPGCAVASPSAAQPRNSGVFSATTNATGVQQTSLKAAASAVLARNYRRNQTATTIETSATNHATQPENTPETGDKVAQLRCTRERNHATQDPVILLREKLPLLADDVKFIRRCLLKMGAYLGQAETICQEYETRWQEAMKTSTQENRGRYAANSWLRRYMESEQ